MFDSTEKQPDRWCCVCRFGGLGDDLIASSVFPGLRRRFGKLAVITRAPNHLAFENNPHIDHLMVWPEDDLPMDAVAWQRKLADRAKEYPDAFFDLSHSCEVELALLEGQAAFWRSPSYRRKQCDVSYLEHVHDICDLPYDFAPRFYPTEAETLKAHDKLSQIRTLRHGPIVGWCLAGSRVDKLYPYSAAVIGRLIIELGANVIMFGGPSPREKALTKTIQEQVTVQNGSDVGLYSAVSHDAEADKIQTGFVGRPSPHMVAGGAPAVQAGQWPIRRTLSTLALCDLVISPATGAAWSVAMLDMPKVVLLSHASVRNIVTGWVNTTALHADPRRVGCWSCHRLHDSFDTCKKAPGLEAAACMADITSQSVIDAAQAALVWRKDTRPLWRKDTRPPEPRFDIPAAVVTPHSDGN